MRALLLSACPVLSSDTYHFAEFQSIQSIPTIGALDWEAFAIGGEQYLAVANYCDSKVYKVCGDSVCVCGDSKVYKWTNSTDCPAGGLEIDISGTPIISPFIADGQMQTVACPKAGEVQLSCTTREVTERERTPDCGVSSTTVSSTAVSSTTMTVDILALAVFVF